MSGRDTFSGTLEDCFRLHAETVRRKVAARIVGDSDLADDACAFAWMQAARYWPLHASAEGWLLTTARRFAWAEQAKRKGRDAATLAPDIDADPLGDPQSAAENAEVLAALTALPATQRMVLTARVIGLSYAEIDESTGHAERWAENRATKGRAALRAAFSDDDTNRED